MPTTLVLSPADAPGYLPGAVLVDADCGHRAWISTSGLALKLGGGVTTRCEDCVDPAEAAGPVTPVPGARDSLVGVMGEAAADAVMKTFAADPARALRMLQAGNRRRRN